MALLDRTVFHAKKNGPEEFFLRYREVCASLMGKFVFLIMRVREDFLELDPSAEQWRRVVAERVGDSELASSDTIERTEVRAVLARVEGRASEVRTVAPLLVDEQATDDALKKTSEAAQNWPVR